MTRKKFASHHFSPRHITKKSTHDIVVSASFLRLWALTDSNRRPSACKANAYDRNSLIINYL